jgi:hypothetical protein
VHRRLGVCFLPRLSRMTSHEIRDGRSGTGAGLRSILYRSPPLNMIPAAISLTSQHIITSAVSTALIQNSAGYRARNVEVNSLCGKIKLSVLN